MSKNVLTTGQVAKLCHVAPRTVTKWFDSGQLKGYRIPGSKDRRIPVSDLLSFMRDHNIPTNEIEKGKLRILIIDSQKEAADELREKLSTKGSFIIHSAHNSFDAGLMASKLLPNIILIDLMSSEIDALEICLYAKKCEDLKHCSVIALAAGLGIKEVENLRQLGYDNVIPDPNNLNSVLHAISDSCDL